MRKLFCLALVLCLLTSSSAFALGYKQTLDNEATFETLEEARVSGPTYLAGYTGRTYIPDPAMDTYPAGTTYVYRSPEMFTCKSAAFRMNTNILVFTDEAIADKAAAETYLKDLGLFDIINEAHGSAILVTPANKETGFGQADQYAYFQLQSAMCNIGFNVKVDDTTTNFYADGAYYGGLTNRYVIGIGGGATFVNDYIASSYDYVTRIAGMLLIGGGSTRAYDIASFVPTYLVNATEATLNKYKEANGVDASGYAGDVYHYFNQQFPLRQVYAVEDEAADAAAYVHDAYYGMFIKAMRIPVYKANANTAGLLYANYNFNQTPYSLSERNAVFNGKTADGLVVTEYQNDQFSAIKTEKGMYLDTWYEVLPEEVLDGTAPAGTIPLILANHGGGDDCVQFLDEIGWLSVAGKERIAIVAPERSGITEIQPQVLPEVVRYMLAKYPALDASRVYVTGYSMGGSATYHSIYNDSSLFAAAAPMSAVGVKATEEQAAQYEKLDLPIMFLTLSYDLSVLFNSGTETVVDGYIERINDYLGYNGMDPLGEIDFNKYPVTGFRGDVRVDTTLNGEFSNTRWYFQNDDGVPMVMLCYTRDLIHSLYQEYAKIGWDYMKCYSRNQETMEIEYNPNAK